MSQSNTRVGDVPFTAGEDLTGFEGRLVKLGASDSDPVALLPESVADVTLYVLIEAAVEGEQAALRPLNPDQNVRVKLKDACDPGDVLVLADPSVAEDKGKIRALPADAGTYRGLLVAEESGVDGQLVLARPAMLGHLVVE